MRIKCPNSDIMLELPGDRMDMKFNCPACHKVHRVTITITTPSEEPVNRAATRSIPQVPKKYATGAFAPVVDIPIDANFILLDRDAASASIDLGNAADPLGAREQEQGEAADESDPDSQRTVFRPPDPPPHDAGGTARVGQSRIYPDPNDPDATVPVGAPEKPDPRMIWDGMPEHGASPLPETGTSRRRGATVSAAQTSEYRRGRARGRRQGVGRSILFLLLLAVVGGIGYLGHQQYLYNRTRSQAERHINEAEFAWSDADLPRAAAEARLAGESLRESGEYQTAGKLWGRFGEWSGLFSSRPSGSSRLVEKIREHTARAEKLHAFNAELDLSDAAGMAALLREKKAENPGDKMLETAMERSALAVVLSALAADADSAEPEENQAAANAYRQALRPAFSQDGRREFEDRVSGFLDTQRRRLVGEVRTDIEELIEAAANGEAGAIERYRDVILRMRRSNIPELGVSPADLADDADRDLFDQLSGLSSLVARAESTARSVLGREENDDAFLDDLMRQARELDSPSQPLAERAVKLIDAARETADDLLGLRLDVFSRLQSEMRRNRDHSGTRLAWAMLVASFGDPVFEIDPAGFTFDSGGASMRFAMNGLPGVMTMSEEDYERRVRAEIDGFEFVSGWTIVFHKPLSWMTTLARDMRRAGINPALYPKWEVLEGPGAPVALSVDDWSGLALASVPADSGERLLFFEGSAHPVTALPLPEDHKRIIDDFRRAAELLEQAVMEDETISQPLRQALKPILAGTYGQPDPRDYFDSAFCRRLIEADYLETYIDPMPRLIRSRLAEYRRLLGKMEAGYDEFLVELEDGRRLFAVARPDGGMSGEGRASDQDPETGETYPRLAWRIEDGMETVFHSPQPSRFNFAFMLAEHYSGMHKSRPAGVPELTEVWHATRGRVASYRKGAETAEGDPELWDAAVAEDSGNGFTGVTSGPPGWNYPLHVLQRDDQGDPVLLATLSGVVRTPDFSMFADAGERRRAEDEWLDVTAATFSSPGELGLIFHQFFRYCSDSPLPELPNLIGSHVGLSDTHQTVYESLERRWVGRLIGDCDDLAEFFQVLTRRQGKLSHVMHLPGHAAAGYVERTPDDGYRFIVLQTGPVLQFTAPTLNEVVETAYRSFDRGEGMSPMTTDAVPLLLRFADEETRTPFVLSARIYEDAEYADTMIRVQAFWHEHVYSAALGTMEKLVEEDQEIGNIKELGSLYERVGFYDKSEAMRRRELEMVRDNPQASMSTLLEIVQLHFQDKNREKALEALGEMEAIMLKMIKDDDAAEFFRNMTFRSYWAMYMSRLGQGARALNLMRYDINMTKRRLGRMAEQVLRTLVFMHDRMCVQRDGGSGGGADSEFAKALAEIRRELEEAFGRGYFKADDSYNNIISRYFVMGRYAVSDAGREKGLRRLLQDGPYPDAPKDQTQRGRGVGDDDWKWFRITPQLFYALGTEMVDADEFPEFYDPAAARPILERVAKAAAVGAGLGSDVAGGDDVVKAELTLAFLNNDLDAFRRAMATVKEKDYSSLYDDAAMTFGLNCGLVPLSEFRAWTEAFREFFPGSQHYFKVVYRAIDKEHYDHALVMAEATARFFPEEELLAREAEFVRAIVPGLKARKQGRKGDFYRDAATVPGEPSARPAA